LSVLSRRIAALEASLPPQPSPGGEDLSFLSDEELEDIAKLLTSNNVRDEDFELIRTIVEAAAAREGAKN
jgi:hypothetical protein